MKKFTQYLCVLIALLTLFTTTAFAAEYKGSRASSYFVATSAKLKNTSSGLEITFDVTGTATMDQIGARSVVIQKSTDGSSWSTVKTYTKDAYPEMLASNTGAHTGSFTYVAAKGYYYKAYVVFYAKKGTGTGEYTHYSSTVKI